MGASIRASGTGVVGMMVFLLSAGVTAAADFAGGTGLMTAQMQMAETFISEGWDLRSTWTISAGSDYPRSRWESVPQER